MNITEKAFKIWFNTIPNDFVFTHKTNRKRVSQYCPLGEFAYQLDPKGNWRAGHSELFRCIKESMHLKWMSEYVDSFDTLRLNLKKQ